MTTSSQRQISFRMDSRVRIRTLMSHFASQLALASAAHAKMVWLGDGLGFVPVKVNERMWKCDMEDLCQRSTKEKFTPGNDMEKLMAMRGTQWGWQRSTQRQC